MKFFAFQEILIETKLLRSVHDSVFFVTILFYDVVNGFVSVC